MVLEISLNAMAKPSAKCVIRGDVSGLDGRGWVWPNICDPKSHMSEIFRLYGIFGIPDNILIDCKTGIIIGRDLHGDMLDAKLEELLD